MEKLVDRSLEVPDNQANIGKEVLDMSNSDEVKNFNIELAEMLLEKFPGEILEIPHRVWAVIGENEKEN